MSGERPGTPGHVAELRSEFNRSFAEPPLERRVSPSSFLRIRLAGDAYAIRLGDIRGLHATRSIARVPSRSPELIGVTAVRGGIVPVFSLRLFVGYPPSLELSQWVVLGKSEQSMGFAFDAFDGHFRIADAEVSPVDTAARAHVRESARAPEALLPVISIESIEQTISDRTSRAGRVKEP